MVIRFLVSCVLAILLLTTSAMAGAFDCAKPQYGKPLATMNDSGYFVKFKEDGGVAYYNFTGPCKLGVHERLAPTIVYGVVDGNLYSRVMRTEHDDIEIIKQVTSKLAGTPKTTVEGEWTVMRWNFPEKQIKMKLKYNNTTKATKSALYFEPLRPGMGDGNGQENSLDD